jgi:mono/diheme cytochrome c family protein/glucose/arabinose dehydrogenase
MTLARRTVLVSLALISAALTRSFAADTKKPAEEPLPPMPKPPMLSPAEELKTFQLPDGYRLELVLADPDIKEPVQIQFDGNGRMYVAEMRAYMQDIDGKDEHAPVSRVSRHESTKGDGVYDKHTVFADKLVLPRMLLPLDERVIIGETDTSDLFLYTDKDGDGVADDKVKFFEGGPRGGNLEHQPSGLTWAMDNWLYSAVNSYRIRWVPGTALPTTLKENTGANGGQWGMTQDDHGKPWVVNGGGEKGPLRFQTHILYGGIDLKEQFGEDFREVFPAVGLADVQGGPNRFRPENKTLNHFTATCGGEIFRGDRLPADMKGDLLFGEPVGRLVRRAKVEVKDGITYLTNATPGSEFIRSTDPNFRPVSLSNGPDGCLYIVDMYRGIIQEGNWVREGSYLRKIVQQYSLDKNFGGGRVWRLVHKDFKPGEQPKMLSESPAQLVKHLEHPNGWWRDTAQKLLVMRQDKSVVSSLEELARTSTNYLTRMHAMWTLEGLDAVDKRLLREKMHDAHPQVRITAIRIAEPLLKKGDGELMTDFNAAAHDTDPNVVVQYMCTAKLLNLPDHRKAISTLVLTSTSQGVKKIGSELIPPGFNPDRKKFSRDEISLMLKGETIYKELCFACHGLDGKGMPSPIPPTAHVDPTKATTLAPPLSGSRTVLGHRDADIYVLLKGLSGPVDKKTYEAQMVTMGSNDDEWIAAVLSYVRNTFGNSAPPVKPADVKRLREATKDRSQPYTLEEIAKLLPHIEADRDSWKVTASHNPAKARLALDDDMKTRWDTGKKQEPGMWYQIELPKETVIGGIHLDTTGSNNDYPRKYEVTVSTDGKNWSKPVAAGEGKRSVTDIEFKPVKTRFIRITQLGSSPGNFWSIHEMTLLPPPEVKESPKQTAKN